MCVYEGLGVHVFLFIVNCIQGSCIAIFAHFVRYTAHFVLTPDEERIGAKRKKKLQHFNSFFGDGGAGLGGGFFKGNGGAKGGLGERGGAKGGLGECGGVRGRLEVWWSQGSAREGCGGMWWGQGCGGARGGLGGVVEPGEGWGDAVEPGEGGSQGRAGGCGGGARGGLLGGVVEPGEGWGDAVEPGEC